MLCHGNQELLGPWWAPCGAPPSMQRPALSAPPLCPALGRTVGAADAPCLPQPQEPDEGEAGVTQALHKAIFLESSLSSERRVCVLEMFIM